MLKSLMIAFARLSRRGSPPPLRRGSEGDQALKAREERRKVMLSAKIRLGASWGSARILNISPRGMLLESADAPDRGTYVEICRGRHTVVARVVWNRDNQFGLVAQDRLPVDSIISDSAQSKAGPPAGREPAAEGRFSAPRSKDAHAQRFESSRLAARGFQFAAIAAFGATAAVSAYATVRQSLACPISSVAAALSGNEAPAACS